MGVAELHAQYALRREAGVHAGQDGDLTQGTDAQCPGGEISGVPRVVGEQLVVEVHVSIVTRNAAEVEPA